MFTPARQRLSDHLDALGGAAHAAEAWELLYARGLLPEDALRDPRRVFICPDCLRRDTPGFARVDAWCGDRHAWYNPPTIRAAAVLAADWANVLLAEQLGWEIASRLEAWGVARPARVAWAVYDVRRDGPPAAYYYCRSSCFNLPQQTIIRNDGEGWLSSGGLDGGVTDWTNRWLTDRLLCGEWKRLANAGRKVPPFDGHSSRLGKVRMCELPNPFEPAVEVWKTGYAFHDICGEHLVLVASEV